MPNGFWGNIFKLKEMVLETLVDFSYSSDLFFRDYCLFTLLKESLVSKRTIPNQWRSNWLTTRPLTFYEQGISRLPNWWKKCILFRRLDKDKCVDLLYYWPKKPNNKIFVILFLKIYASKKSSVFQGFNFNIFINLKGADLMRRNFSYYNTLTVDFDNSD